MKTIIMNAIDNINTVQNSHRYGSISTRSLELALCPEQTFKGDADWSIKS